MAQIDLNSVWYDSNKVPQKGKLVLFECKREYGSTYTVNYGENFNIMKEVIIKWAYINDLTPKE